MRLANHLARERVPGAPAGEADKFVWAASHARRLEDKKLSEDEERLRTRLLPIAIGQQQQQSGGTSQNFSTSGADAGDHQNLFHYRDYPMFPGEYVPAGHNTLASLRDELKADLTAQNLKDAWMRVSGGAFFDSPEQFYGKVDGLDEDQLAEIVSALFPKLGAHESGALIRRVLESISKSSSAPARRLASTVTAEALGLDNAPGHYTNFLEWMGRMTATKAFATEHALFQFSRRKFNRRDVQMMWENYNLMSPDALAADRADGYSHFHTLLKDFAIKVAGRDTRHQIGVRIDPQEVDPRTGFAFGYGMQVEAQAVALIRENRNGTGEVFAHGKPLREAMYDQPWVLEHVLWTFDEAGVDARDFDVYIINKSKERHPGDKVANFAKACRLALARALSNMMPITRIKLKKAGLLTFDRSFELGQHSGFLGGGAKRRMFKKRA